MTLLGFKAQNHPQQTSRRGPNPEVDDRATHPDDFARFAAQHGPFTLDAAAQPHNTKCDRFFTPEENGLEQSWAGERVWVNPPYSSIEPWVAKAWDEHEHCPLIVMLLPNNRSEQSWFQRHVEPYRDGRGTVPGEVFVPLSNTSERVLVDVADVALLAGRRWRLDRSTGYVVASRPRDRAATIRRGDERLHQLLCPVPVGHVVDHVNRDRLDCRRSNLRPATPQQNAWNQGITGANTSGYKGVSWTSVGFEARIRTMDGQKFLGYFDTAEEAAHAYDAGAVAYHGEFACTNAMLASVPWRSRRHLTVEFLPGRLRFIRVGQTDVGPNERPPFGSVLLVWGLA